MFSFLLGPQLEALFREQAVTTFPSNSWKGVSLFFLQQKGKMLPLFLYSSLMVRSFFYDALPSVIEDWTNGFYLLGEALPSSCKGLCVVKGSVCEGDSLCTHWRPAWVQKVLQVGWREGQIPGLEAAMLGMAAGSSPSSWESSCVCLLFNCDLWFVCRNRLLPAADWPACWATHLLRLFSAHESFNENDIYIEKGSNVKHGTQ